VQEPAAISGAGSALRAEEVDGEKSKCHLIRIRAWLRESSFVAGCRYGTRRDAGTGPFLDATPPRVGMRRQVKAAMNFAMEKWIGRKGI